MKIVIVGAGPIGCYTGQLLKRKGYNPVLLEEHDQIGRPVKCAGIVGKEVFEKSKLTLSQNSIINKIDGAHIFYQKHHFSIHRPHVAYIINRTQFDQNLSEGLDIRYQFHAHEFQKKNGRYLIHNKEKKTLEADILIGADGPDSKVRTFLQQQCQQKTISYPSYYYGYQYRVDISKSGGFINNKLVQVHFHPDLPFFFWVIPESKQIIRLGIIGEQVKKKLQQFMSEKNICGEIIDTIAGKIPIGHISTVAKDIALVGDAACQIKPLTGGGIFYGLQSAEILVDCIVNQTISQYDLKWKQKRGKEIRFGLIARKIYES